MPCKNDVKQAILNKVYDELIDRRNTFSVISDDSIQVNGVVDNSKTKAQNRKQAHAIAQELIDRTKKSFNNHVDGYITEHSQFDPITVTFTVNPKYVDHVYNNTSHSDRVQSTNNVDETNRDYINDNVGPNTVRQIMLFDPSTREEPATGVYVKYIQFKKDQIAQYEDRISKIKSEKKKRGITAERLVQLNRQEREINKTIHGSFELGIKGLTQEIAELEKNATTEAVKYYVQKDLQRLDGLANSKNVDDLREAQRLVDFYTLAGTFEWGDGEGTESSNPFFSKEDIFLADENGKLTSQFKLSPETMAQYEEWKNTASYYQNLIDKRKEEMTVDFVNSDPSIKRTYGERNFGFGEITNSATGLRDTDWVSMWTMDITNGIFSHNGMLPQVMFSKLVNSAEQKLGWSRGIEERIDELHSDLQRELVKMGHSLRGVGILGVQGASFNLFKEISKEGNETGGVIRRYNKEFYDEQDRVLNNFRQTFDKAKLIEDYQQRATAFNKGFEQLKQWRRANTIMMDISKIPEITSDSAFPEITGTPDDTHKRQLIAVLGQKGYDEQVEEQKRMLRKYQSDKQSFIEEVLIQENKNSFDELSEKGKNDVSYWDSNHSPLKGIEDYNNIAGIFFGDRKANNFMDYNNFIPRRNKATITANTTTNQYNFTDTNATTGHYSQAFESVEGNATLSKFYDIIKEVTETIRENIPYELQQKMGVNTLPGLLKTSAEMIADKNTGILNSLLLAYRRLKDRLRTNFGVTKQSELSYATLDPITGKPNYKVNDGFLQGNSRAIAQRTLIEKTKFLQAYNSTISNPEHRLKDIKKFSGIPISQINPSALVLLAQYLHIDNLSMDDIQAGRISPITSKTGTTVEVGRLIRDFATHSVVQTQSFDLPKLLKYFSNMTMMYAARQEALPTLEIMKKHYEGIQKPDTTNLGKAKFNVPNQKLMKAGPRTGGIRQIDDWFNRVVLDDYGPKHAGVFGTEYKVGSKIPILGENIYTREERLKYNELSKLIANEPDEAKKEELIKAQRSLGKTRTATAIVDNLLNWVRTLRLGYNLSSATTNFLEGVTSNMILGASDEYFDPKELFYGYNVIRHSFLKNITFGRAETGLAQKNRSLMDKFNVIMDSKNELQKSSHKTYSSRFSWMNPHEINQRVEYINQSPIMIAMLRTQKIKDKSGAESSIWDAYNNDGHLKDNFRTEENLENWEDMSGDGYLNFKQKLHKVIVLGHGNYDELRGMMVKSNSIGKAGMMFKTWLPQQLYWRFATQQDDIQSDTIGYKGRYLSYGKGSAMLHGALVGLASAGILGAAIGAPVGYLWGRYKGVDPGVGLLKETLVATKQLLMKSIGIPVNLLAGRQLIGIDNKEINSWVGNGNFTAQDAKNLKGNMADICMQLAWLAMILMTKKLFWDDDDKPDDTERQAHNILVNKLMQLSTQAAMYTNPVDTWKATLGSMATVQYLQDCGKWVDAANGAMQGRDIIASGSHSGESQLWNQTRKIALPGLFKDGNPVVDIAKGHIPSLGFKSQSERVYPTESPFHNYFKSDEAKDKDANKRARAAKRSDLQSDDDIKDIKDEKERKKAIQKILNEKLPTPSKLKKLKETREEYNKEHNQ